MNLVDVYGPPVMDDDSSSPTYGRTVAPHTHYDYDASGNQIDQISPGYNAASGALDTTTFTYDENGNEVSRTMPDSTASRPEVEYFTYNQYGQEATHTDFDGNLATYTYYSTFGSGAYTGNVQKIVYTPGADAAPGTTSQTVTYTYDDVGDQLTVTDASGTTTNTYDNQGNLIEQQTPEGTINYVFDPATGNHTETYTSDTDTLYGYNAQGELTSVTVEMLDGQELATPLMTSYTYDAAGNLLTETLPDGEVTTYSYDDENRLLSEVTMLNGTTIFSETFTLNADGTRATASESQLQPNGTTVITSTAWTYDADQRLISETYTSSASGESYSTAYAYDLAGNRTSEQHTGPGDGASANITYVYNGDDQLTSQSSADVPSDNISYTYDLNGSQLISTSGGVVTTYVYDVRNKMVAVEANGTTTATYVYDDDGNRVQETTGGTTSLYLTDTQNPTGYAQPLEVRQGSTVAAALASAPTTTYLLGNRVLGQADANGDVSYLLVDGHGSTEQVSNAAGAVTAAFRYDAFGTGLNFTAASAPTVFLFGGDAVYDAASGLYLHGDGVRGVDGFRFVEADEQDNGSNSDPITLHKYLYANGDPINVVDPSGHDGLADLLVSMGIDTTLAGIVLTGVAASYVSAQHSAAFINAASAVTNDIQDLLSSGVSSLESEAAVMASNTAAVVNAIDAAIAAAGAAAIAAWKDSSIIPPIFPVIRSMGPQIYAFDTACLTANPAWYVLNYNGVGSPQTAINRGVVWAAYGGLMATAPANYELDEFPFAATQQGGVGLTGAGPAVGKPVYWLQNRVQGGLFGAFTRYTLKGKPFAPFLVVPVPL